MARRGWVWVVGVGLCGGLLSACAHTVTDHFATEAAALRCYMDRSPDEAIAHLQVGDPASQELLLSLLPVVARLAEGGKSTPRDTALVLDQLDTLVEPVRAKAALVIDKVCFCRDMK